MVVKTTLLAIGSFLVAFLLAEFALTIFGVVPIKPEGRLEGLAPFDSLFGWMGKPNVNLPYYDHRVMTNSLGFRDGEWNQQGKHRIFLLGDSQAWGWGVWDGQSFANLIEKKTGVEVLNMSQSGYSPDQELLLYQKYGKQFEHDLVLLQLCGNDPWYCLIKDVLLYSRKPRFEFVIDSTKLKMSLGLPERLTALEKTHRWIVLHSKIFGLIWNYSHREFSLAYTEYDVSPNGLNSRCLLILSRLREIVEKNNARLVICYNKGIGFWLPSFGQWDGFIKDCNLAKFDMISLEYDELYQPEYLWIDNKHFGVKGHEFISEKIVAGLEKRQYLDADYSGR